MPRQTIRDLKKNADEIEKFASQMESLDIGKKKRKTMKKSHHEVLDTAYVWFVQKRSQEIPLSGPLICDKALFCNSKLNGERGPTVFSSKTSIQLFSARSKHRERVMMMDGTFAIVPIGSSDQLLIIYGVYKYINMWRKEDEMK